jgi:hypothetical protein
MDSKDIAELDVFFSDVDSTINSLQKRIELLGDPELMAGLSNLNSQMALLKTACAVMQTEWITLKLRHKTG